MTRVIGVDACKKGWVGLTSDRRGYFGPTIDELVATADGDGQLQVVAIDIPIGLQGDGLARPAVAQILSWLDRRQARATTPNLWSCALEPAAVCAIERLAVVRAIERLAVGAGVEPRMWRWYDSAARSGLRILMSSWHCRWGSACWRDMFRDMKCG